MILVALFLTINGAFSQKQITLEGGETVLANRLHVKLKNNNWQSFSNSLNELKEFELKNFNKKFQSSIHIQSRTSNPLQNIYEIAYESQKSIKEVIEMVQLSADNVEYVEPVYVRHIYDDLATDPLAGQQYHLEQIQLSDALSIVSDASDIVIAIVDSGVDLDHVDLADNIYLNSDEIPGNGIDDDSDGYIDNYTGWDFVGSSISDIINAPVPIDWSDFEDSDPNTNGSDHGTHVAGIASAITDNDIGIKGVGANAKLMVLKCGEDAGGEYPRSILRGYDAIVYAAENGADVINCSWGGPGFSQFEQDIINYATELGSLIVAAAGNDGTEVVGYPASYNNVLSVANVNSDDARASSTTFNNYVDVSAPGVDILSTVFVEYGEKTGTSMSSPVVAGVAALVKKRFPTYSPNQIGEQIRISSDDISDINTPSLKYKIGKGRVNAYKALTTSSPAVRVTDFKLIDNDFSLQAGDEVTVTVELTNYLSETSNLRAEFSIPNVFTMVNKSTASIGAVASGETVVIENAFSFTIKEGSPDNMEIDMIITFSDANGYEDWQIFSAVANQTYLNILTEEIASSVSSNGRLGYLEAGAEPVGLGFVFNEENLLYEMGLLVGTGENALASSIRNSDQQNADDDFNIISKASSVTDLSVKKADIQISGVIDDSNAEAPNNVEIAYNAYAWNSIGVNNFYIIEYIIKNNSAKTISSLSSGLYSDWDIIDAANNSSGFNADRNLGYVYSGNGEAYYASVGALSGGNVSYTPINNADFTFNSINNFNAISGGINSSTLSNVDVSNFVGVTSDNIPAGGTVTHAYVILGASSYANVMNAYDTASYLYNTVFNIDRPDSYSITSCSGETVDLSVSGETSLKWYDSFTGGTLLGEGATYTTDVLNEDAVFFVAITSGSDEGVRTPVYVNVVPERKISYNGDLVLCGDEVTVLTAPEGDVYLWSTGETTRSITINSAGNYNVTVTDNASGCTATSEVLTFSQESLPTDPIVNSVGDFCIEDNVELSISSPLSGLDYEWLGPNGFYKTGSTITINSFDNNNIGEYTVVASGEFCQSNGVSISLNPVVKRPIITFVDGIISSDVTADSYQWYLDGEAITGATSSTFEPELSGLYSLEITKGICTVQSSQVEFIILSNTDSIDENFDFVVYPNPANSFLIVNKYFDKLFIYDLSGQQIEVFDGNIAGKRIDLRDLSEGTYILAADDGNKVYSTIIQIRK